ncbi:MAG: hypothetical protein NTZ78_07775 [Candidatus Aureabacteria bacterium]|nr:hypothetical protein [Candidatus Auribacterota bacterium]
MPLIIFALALFAASIANALPANSPFPQRYNFPFSSDLGKNDELQQPSIAIPKIGKIIEGNNLIWGDSIGWVNLRTTHADLKIGSNILAGWIWLENCGWVCLGDGYPLKVGHYSNRGSCDWGVNNDGQGKLSGFAWSEVTGWVPEICGSSVPVTGLNNSYQRSTTEAWPVCLLRIGRDDSCAHIRCCDTPVHIASLAKLSPIRAPPHCG